MLKKNTPFEIILTVILLLLCIFTAWKAYTIKEKVEYINTTDTLFINDTITDWNHDTMYLSHFDTVKFPVVDTINDTIIKTDSILVQIPINTYIYDSVINDSLYKTDLRAVVSGFNVSMDSLYLNTEIMPQKVKKAPWYTNICPAVGVGFGTGGQIGLFFGIGYTL